MAILTQKELSERGLSPLSDKLNKKASNEVETIKEVKQDKKIFEWFLMHPENNANGYLQAFQDVLEINGKPYNRICYRGVVKTKEEVLAKFLLNKGYFLMSKEEL